MHQLKKFKFSSASTDPLEHKFGCCRKRSKYVHTLNNFLGVVSHMQTMQQKEIFINVTNLEKIHCRNHSFGVVLEKKKNDADRESSEVFISINSWLNRENDFSEVWNEIQSAIEAKFVEFNIGADKINKDHNFNLDNQELKLSTIYSNLITEYQNLQKTIEDLTNKIFNEKDEKVKAELQKELDKKNDEDKINIATRYNVQKEMEKIREEIKLNELKPTFHEEKTGLRLNYLKKVVHER